MRVNAWPLQQAQIRSLKNRKTILDYQIHGVQELCESRGGHPRPSRWPSVISLVVSVDVKQHERRSPTVTELKSRVKVEVDVLGSPSLIARTVSVDVKQH